MRKEESIDMVGRGKDRGKREERRRRADIL